MKTTILVLIGVLFLGCAGRENGASKDAIVVSIEPLKWLIESIVGDDFEVTVLVPAGAGPETFEPTPAQVEAAENARLIFSTCLIDFERELVGRLARPERMADLSEGIQLIDSQHDTHDNGDHNHHHHGADPHIWTSPRALLKMAQTAYRKIYEIYPDSASYSASYARLTERLTELDETLTVRFSRPEAARSFMIFHPGLTYFTSCGKFRSKSTVKSCRSGSYKRRWNLRNPKK